MTVSPVNYHSWRRFWARMFDYFLIGFLFLLLSRNSIFALNNIFLYSALQLIVVAGNHDSAGRLEAPGPLLAAHGIVGTVLVQSSELDVTGSSTLMQLLAQLPLLGKEDLGKLSLSVQQQMKDSR